MSDVVKFGPRELKSDGGEFLLSRAEWFTIQVYVENALRLPLTVEAMRSSLDLPAAESFEPFRPILEAYTKIAAHCKTWKDDTFPDSVSLAGDIVSYNLAVPSYYRAMVPHINTLLTDPDNARARKMLATILTRLNTEATAHAAHAGAVCEKVKKFAGDTEDDQKLLGTPEHPGLLDQYKKSHGAESAEAKELEAQLAEARRLLQEAHDEYERDKIIAATSPAYLWLPILGWVLAPVVAGVFTDKALKALHAAERAGAEVKRLQGKIARNALTIHHLELAQAGIANIKESMDAALPSILKIRDTWTDIAAGFHDLIQQLQQGGDLDLPQSLRSELEMEIDSWDALARRADEYRTNAYITVAERAA